ncbi:MAG TPA: hypothetical protein PKN04_01410 [bacterium]|jgi:hypothetical protein|nr:hypothetical protein [bacterium]HNT64417.1 hypothetical protein [bacterium]HOX84735.1 hypothetical protein [bacterium]HPG45458.1 hypothetical protein [bacterium]HPM96766.1 hypothetical protein [bacterium]
MNQVNREESGWLVAKAWLAALEETARDFHGNRPQTFLERAYQHATEHFLRTLENDYGIYPKRTLSIKEALDEYIRLSVLGGLFKDAGQFNLTEVNVNRVEVTSIECPYHGMCRELLYSGISAVDLTCPRLGCFRAAVNLLADIDCTYEMTEIMEKGCHGYIERR